MINCPFLWTIISILSLLLSERALGVSPLLRKTLDNHESAAAILKDLSMAFDCLPHDLLIAKLRAYGLSKGAVGLLDQFKGTRDVNALFVILSFRFISGFSLLFAESFTL